MIQIDRQYLPTSDELPDSDDTPVDNEDQNFVPNLLLFLLEYIWKNRDDWYFGVDMGVYHTTGVSPRVPIVPDGFLSLGVERRKNGGSRSSYVMWEENSTPPILTLEVVSHTYGDEYEKKLDIYRKLGVKYYVIYNPQFCRRDGHLPFEIYKLVDSEYQLQIGEPLWMPEIGLGIGRAVLPSDRFRREVLGWFDEQGQRYLTGEENADIEMNRADIERQKAKSEKQRADAAQKQVELLLAKLRSLGIDEE
jgi:Uma2 family endonuclease